jgi:hypothetical protein
MPVLDCSCLYEAILVSVNQRDDRSLESIAQQFSNNLGDTIEKRYWPEIIY